MVADDPDTEARELAPADARVRITEAIEHGALIYPPYESDSWPASRPLVEWMTGLLPTGGVGYPRVRTGATPRTAELTERFLGSPHGAGLDDPDHRSLLESLLWFGTDYGPGDPLGWSPTRVEILLLDWLPRKIVADAEFLAKAPELLRALIRFSHHERGIRTALTEQTLRAVDEFEPEYQRLVRSPRPQGPAALLAAMGVPIADAPWESSERRAPRTRTRCSLDFLARDRRRRGRRCPPWTRRRCRPRTSTGSASRRTCTTGWREVLERVDDCCTALLDLEYRTAARRLLAALATADPDIFRRRARADTAAAAVCWIVGRANGLFDPTSQPHLQVEGPGRAFRAGPEHLLAAQRALPAGGRGEPGRAVRPPGPGLPRLPDLRSAGHADRRPGSLPRAGPMTVGLRRPPVPQRVHGPRRRHPPIEAVSGPDRRDSP